MFESNPDRVGGSAADLLDLASKVFVEVREGGCRQLQLAAAWADLHSTPITAPSHANADSGVRMDAERMVDGGPRGCPAILETAPAELALVFHTSIGGAKSWIRDSLNLRHRLPRIWARVCAGEVLAWKVRIIARRTAHLNPVAAGEVDRSVVEHVETLAWQRFENLLDATLLHVDEKTYQERAAKLATHRNVWATESAEGMRTLIARCDAGDVTLFLALVERIADALADDGDDDPVDARRAKAIGIAAYPDRALDLLLRHRQQPDTTWKPWETADADRSDPSDPWPEPAPGAGWQNAEYGNYHQPDADDPDYRNSFTDPGDEPVEEPADAHSGPSTGSAQQDAGADQDVDQDAGRYANTGGINLRAALAAFGQLSVEDLNQARPKIVIHLHLTDETLCTGRGVIRTSHGPITADQLRRFLGDTGGDIHVHPVLDPARLAPVDGYEIPPRIRRAACTRNPGSIFPFSPSTTGLDLDHLEPYQRGGPPGQTYLDGLGPQARPEHRTKTHGRWKIRQPDPGTYLWRTRTGLISVVTNQGTLLLGRSPFTQALWDAAGAAGAATVPAHALAV